MSNYSFKTSLPAYFENIEGKEMQEKLVLYVMNKHKGKATLKEIQIYLKKRFRITLPQSTISGRMGDLRDKGKVAFFGETKIYLDRLRKVFEIITSKNRRKKRIPKNTKVVFEKVEPRSYKLVGKVHTLVTSDRSIWVSTNGLMWKRKPTGTKTTFGRSLKKD